ncbi:MAG: hypothetical protein ACI9KE_006052, partial [Polyangiales bacterium]
MEFCRSGTQAVGKVLVSLDNLVQADNGWLDIMVTEELRVSTVVSASPNRIYTAWMDERMHSAFTGQKATVDHWVGGRLTAAGGYIDATHVLLDTGKRVVLTWRTADFPLDSADSQVEVTFEPIAGGTKIIIHQTDIPHGQAETYKKTWRTVYLEPMKKFFSSRGAAKKAMLDAGRRGVLPVPGGERKGRRPILGPRPGRDENGVLLPQKPIPRRPSPSEVRRAASAAAAEVKAAAKKAAEKEARERKKNAKIAAKKAAAERASARKSLIAARQKAAKDEADEKARIAKKAADDEAKRKATIAREKALAKKVAAKAAADKKQADKQAALEKKRASDALKKAAAQEKAAAAKAAAAEKKAAKKAADDQKKADAKKEKAAADKKQAAADKKQAAADKKQAAAD